MTPVQKDASKSRGRRRCARTESLVETSVAGDARGWGRRTDIRRRPLLRPTFDLCVSARPAWGAATSRQLCAAEASPAPFCTTHSPEQVSPASCCSARSPARAYGRRPLCRPSFGRSPPCTRKPLFLGSVRGEISAIRGSLPARAGPPAQTPERGPFETSAGGARSLTRNGARGPPEPSFAKLGDHPINIGQHLRCASASGPCLRPLSDWGRKQRLASESTGLQDCVAVCDGPFGGLVEDPRATASWWRWRIGLQKTTSRAVAIYLPMHAQSNQTCWHCLN